MLRTMDELIDVARKNAVSSYTRRIDRSKWVRLCGQLIWYKDSILKNLDVETIRIEMNELQEIIDTRTRQERARMSMVSQAPSSSLEEKRRIKMLERQRAIIPGTMPETDPSNNEEREAPGD